MLEWKEVAPTHLNSDTVSQVEIKGSKLVTGFRIEKHGLKWAVAYDTPCRDDEGFGDDCFVFGEDFTLAGGWKTGTQYPTIEEAQQAAEDWLRGEVAALNKALGDDADGGPQNGTEADKENHGRTNDERDEAVHNPRDAKSKST